METLIRIHPDELKMELLNKIKLLAKKDDAIDILIHIHEKSKNQVFEESPAEYLSQFNRSVKDMEQGRIVSFTADEFEQYVKENFSL